MQNEGEGTGGEKRGRGEAPGRKTNIGPPMETDKIDSLDTEESLDVFLSVSKG